jgi:hypothetical protein
MTTIKEFVLKHDIKMRCVKVEENPNMMDDKGWKANHYYCTLEFQNRKMGIFFSQGLGIKESPKPSVLLDCMISDASCASESFEDFCSNCGYDSDSIKAKKTYELIEEQTKKLKKLLGNDLFNELSDCERL